MVPITYCPEDLPPDSLAGERGRVAPRRAFYDAAAMLRYHVCEECAELNYASKYNHTFYAIIHPDARYCLDGDGNGAGSYDRVSVLQQLGYRVEVKGNPVGPYDIQDPYLRDNVERDMGVKDLMHLHAFTMTSHSVVVMVDFSTLLLQPLDDAVDALLASNATASFTLNYATNLPATGLNQGANLGLFLLKPSWKLYNHLVELYKTATYDPELGWESSGVVGFDGALSTSGLLTYFYQSREFIELPKCIYSNEAEKPRDAVTGQCLNGYVECDNCLLTEVHEIKAGRFYNTCGQPWQCPFDESWDGPTELLCREFLGDWFQKRLRFEINHWRGPESPRDGAFHPDIFLGYCQKTGEGGYSFIIPDAPTPAPSAAPSSSPTPLPTPLPTLLPTSAPLTAPPTNVAIA